jgi:tetratricopeptide (TPR) repeat protein
VRLTLLGLCTFLSSCTRPAPELPKLELDRYRAEIRTAIEPVASEAQAKPNDAGKVLALCMTLHAHDQFQAAAQCYARANALDSKRFDVVYYWGLAMASIGDCKSATAKFRRALELRAGSLPAMLKLADCLMESGETAAARDVYERVLSKDPKNARAHYGLGRTLDGEAAVGEFRQALDLFPRYGAAQFALSAAYRKSGDHQKAQSALRDYERDKTLLPPLDDPELAALQALNASATMLLTQGQELQKEGRNEEAIQHYRKALAKDPSLIQAHLNLIAVFGRLKRDQEAEAAFRKAEETDSNRADLYYTYGVYCLERQRTSDARAAFSKAIQLDPRHAEALHNLGFILETETKLNEAAALYRRALDSKPSYALAHFHLGRIYANQRKYAQAIAEFEKALEPEGEATPRYLYALAATHARAGNRAKAIELMRQARDRAAALGQNDLRTSINRDLAGLGAAQ